MKTAVIIQARMGSMRLPNKVMKPICGRPMIELLLARLSRAKRVDQIIVATSVDPRNQPLVDHVRGLGYLCVQGDENDVLARYLQAATHTDAQTLVRVTGDCPLIDPEVVDDCIDRFFELGVDYLSNGAPPAYPNGLDTEVFRRSALERAGRETSEPYDREHVTPYLRHPDKYTLASLACEQDLGRLRWTVDEPADFEVVTAVVEHFWPNIHVGWRQIVELQRSQPALFAANSHLMRNEGSTMSVGQKLWRRAEKAIAGASMLASKHVDHHLPKHWPAYFSRAKGCEVWDLENRRYTDMGMMGGGANLLGYAHPEVDEAVHQAMAAGTMSSLNCPDEVLLAEKLLELHPWAQQVRLGRSESDMQHLALRISHNVSGQEGLALCMADTHRAATLAKHLGTRRVAPMIFCPEQLEGLGRELQRGTIGAIWLEPSDAESEYSAFMHRLRQLATENRAVLILDETRTGFRQSPGGLHQQVGIEPDLAIFGRALGNGYAISALLGRKSLMQVMPIDDNDDPSCSERIGPAAALKTLEVMAKLRSWELIRDIETDIRQQWQHLASKHQLPITIWSRGGRLGFDLQAGDALTYTTLLTQEMLARSFLAGHGISVSTAHTPEIRKAYLQALDETFQLIAECAANRRPPHDVLKGPVRRPLGASV